jgi:anti-anti-sigma factor
VKLDLASRFADGTATLELGGELDLSTVPEAESTLLELEREPHLETIVLDLRKLEFMDSTGLRFVLAAHARATGSEHRFVVIRGGDTVDRVFRLTLLDERLEFADSPRDLFGDGADA